MIDVIQNINAEHPLLVYEKGVFTSSDYLRLADSHLKIFNKIRGWNISLRGENLFFAKYLPLLEGLVNSLLLIPAETEDEVESRYYNNAEIHGELTYENGQLKLNTINEPKTDNGVNIASPTQWIIPTSGTTGTPKLVAHSLESLTRTTKKDREKGRNIRWALTYDINRFAGLQVFLQSLFSGGSLLIADTNASFQSRIDFFTRNGCNAISGTPSFWRKVMMHPSKGKMNLKHITLGGEIADQKILDHLSQIYPKARILHIYASTEAGVGFSVKDGKEGFPLQYLKDGVQGCQLKVKKDGILYIKPPKKIQSYIGENTLRVYSKDGYIKTGDLVQVDSGRVKFLGRSSGAINIGGNKVTPEEVEGILLKHEKVKEARVQPIRSSLMGALIQAEITPASKIKDPGAFKKEIKQYCFSSMEKYKVPARIKLVEKIEISAAGKKERVCNYA